MTTDSATRGYQAQNVDAIRAERIVCTVRAGQLRVKAVQLVFHKDSSFFISFPYFRHRTGLLSVSSIPANGSRESQVNLDHSGKVTSWLKESVAWRASKPAPSSRTK